jgi:hypothetical protein
VILHLEKRWEQNVSRRMTLYDTSQSRKFEGMYSMTSENSANIHVRMTLYDISQSRKFEGMYSMTSETPLKQCQYTWSR